MTMDITEVYLQTRNHKYLRLDGSTIVSERYTIKKSIKYTYIKWIFGTKTWLIQMRGEVWWYSYCMKAFSDAQL